MLRCLMCRQKKIAWKNLKTHFLARHSKLVSQVMKLFSRNNTRNLPRIFPKPLLSKIHSNLRKANLKRNTQKTRYSGIFAITNPSRTPTPTKDVTQINGDGVLISTNDDKLDEKEDDKSKASNNKGDAVNKTISNKVVKRPRKNNCTKETKNTDETDINSNLKSSCKDNCDESAICNKSRKQSCDTATSNTSLQSTNAPTEIRNKANGNTCRDAIRKSESDTESCSDNGKNILFQNPDYRYYCNICGNGYNNEQKLLNHLQMHAMPPKLDLFDYRSLPPFKVYACYVCTSEFLNKKALLEHLNVHYEYEILESVLEMERDYNLPKTLPHPHPVNLSHMGNMDFKSSMKYITQYLLLNTGDQYYYGNCYNNCNNYHSKNVFYGGCNNAANYYMKTVCDFCYQEMLAFEYSNHLMYAHNVINSF